MKVPFIGNLFNRQQAPSPIRDAMVLSGLNQANSRTDDDVAWKEQQGTNYELIHDDPLEEVLNDLMYESAVAQDPATKQWIVIKRAQINLNMVGLRMVASHVNRCSFNDRKDIEVLKPKMRAMTKLVKMQMRPDTFTLGMSTFIAGFEYATNIALNDSVDGKKAKLLKTIPKITSVEVQTGELIKPKGAK
jgi:hypothetical protein